MDHIRVIVLGVLGIVLAGTAAVFLGGNAPTGSCTEKGCQGDLTIYLPELPSEARFSTYLAIDGIVILDECRDIENARRSTTDPQEIRLNPYYLNHTSEHGTIEELKLGYRPTCNDEPTITKRMTNFSVGYNKYRPNGQGCPPTCISGNITID